MTQFDLRDFVALNVALKVREVVTRPGVVPFDTGALRRSLDVYPSHVSPGVYESASNLPYARAVHDGRPPITIRPRRKKALYWPGARHPVRVVRQPARRPNPYLRRAAEITVNEGFDFVGRRLAEVLGRRVAAEIAPTITINLRVGAWQPRWLVIGLCFKSKGHWLRSH